MEYNINKGIGKSVEFKGLKAQYLFIGKNGKIDPIKTAEIDHLKLCLQKSKKLSVGNGV